MSNTPRVTARTEAPSAQLPLLGSVSAVTSCYCLCLFLWPGLLMGQTNNSAPKYPDNRYLLVVETSRDMQRHADAMTQSVRDLLASALASQARRGDSLGVWTFNEDVYTGLLPLQHLSPDTMKSVSDRVVGVLKAQKLEKRTRFDKLVPAIDRVAKSSAFITIIMVCLADDEIHGTPFDQRLNDFFHSWHQQQQDAGTPFVIAMRAQQGKWVDCSMTPSPWPAELPSLPKELFVPLPATHSPTTEARKQPPPVPPLIVSGKKHEAPSTRLAEITATTNPVIPATNPVGSSEPDSAIGGSRDNSHTTSAAPAGQTGTKPEAFSTPAPPSNAAAGQPNPTAPQTLPATPVGEQQSTAQPDSRLATSTSNYLERGPSVTAQSNLITNIEVATSAPPRRGIYPFILCGVALTSLAVALAGFWVWRRRSHPVREISLITESIDRHRK